MQMGNCNYCRSRELCGWWEAGAAKLGKSVGNTGRSVSVSLLLCLSRKGRKASALPNPKAPEQHDAAPGKWDAAALSPPATPEHGNRPLPDGSASHPAPGGEHKGQVGHARGLPSPASHLREDQEGMPRRTMTLAGSTFPSALPLPCTRGQTWQCQKSSAPGDRNTWLGTHQRTMLTQRPAHKHGVEKMQRSSVSSSPQANPPGPSHQHPPVP